MTDKKMDPQAEMALLRRELSKAGERYRKMVAQKSQDQRDKLLQRELVAFGRILRKRLDVLEAAYEAEYQERKKGGKA